jgi:hypothetical protein
MRPIKPRILVLDGSWFWWEEDFGAAGTYRAGPDGVLDMLVEDEDGVVGLAHNLYRLEGDILLVCYTDGAERPKRFETRPGTDVVITTFKRLRP